ncbi:MAG: hypothetical protein ACLGI3_12345 [Actinomycetes bacterium]
MSADQLADLRDQLRRALVELERAQVCSTTSGHFATNEGWRKEWNGLDGWSWSVRNLRRQLVDVDELLQAGAKVHTLTRELLDELAPEPTHPGPGWPDDQGVRVDLAGPDLAELVAQAAAPTVEPVDDRLADVDDEAGCSCGWHGRSDDAEDHPCPLPDPWDVERVDDDAADEQDRPELHMPASQADVDDWHPIHREQLAVAKAAAQEDFPSDPPAGTPLESSSTGNLPVCGYGRPLGSCCHTVPCIFAPAPVDPGERLPDGRPDTGWERLRPPPRP